jgi:hypothetical protein
MTLRSTALSSRFNSTNTVLCAVLRERLGKPHAGRMCVAPLAWLVQRSNIAHNASGVCGVLVANLNYI